MLLGDCMKKWERFTRQEIEQFVKDSYSWAALAGKLGYSKNGGSSIIAIKAMVEELDLNVSHFTNQGWNKNNFDYNRFRYGVVIKSADAIKAIVYLRGHQCECCGLEYWLDKPIPLELHHVDGNSLNNAMDNLKLLCPNCHALTDNYRGKNINNMQIKVTDDEFIKALQNSLNIRQALIKLGLTAKGENYQRAWELIFKHNITHLLQEHQDGETA